MMKPKKRYESQKSHWERAGEIGYEQAMFSDNRIARHIMGKHWRAAIESAGALGVKSDARVLELGCGDGAFADKVLAPAFKHVNAFDISASAIESAKASASSANIDFDVVDISSHAFDESERWDCVFMMGFLHHVKAFASDIISRLSKLSTKLVVVEPNGNNLIRKALELTPSYRKAGEDSFRLAELKSLFGDSGYVLQSFSRLTLIPPFMPVFLFTPGAAIERVVENIPLLNRLCSTYIMSAELPSLPGCNTEQR